jgi:DNA-binding CsgD family transcriptional regulator
LTEREEEILRWVARGKTNREIASLLFVSPHTVRKHLEHAYAKLGVHSRAAAIAATFAHQN